MRNNLASFVSGPVCRWLIIGLTAVAFTGLFFANNRVWGHEAHPVPQGGEIGAFHAMSAICNAKGASEVAKAGLVSGTLADGNAKFSELATADEPSCWAWGFPVPMRAEEVTYIGTADALHVYIVKFGEDMFAVMTVRRDLLPDHPPVNGNGHTHDGSSRNWFPQGV